MILTKSPEYLRAIANGPISQPDALTCQATCIHAVTGGEESIAAIRANLCDRGVAGDPAVMGAYLREFFGDRYSYDGQASIAMMKSWIGAGEVLITHGWFTGAGHVIILDGCDDHAFRVMDPWEEFSASIWTYWEEFSTSIWAYDGDVSAYLGSYSDRLIYAACVAGQSTMDAQGLYLDEAVDRVEQGAWVHRVRPC